MKKKTNDQLIALSKKISDLIKEVENAKGDVSKSAAKTLSACSGHLTAAQDEIDELTN